MTSKMTELVLEESMVDLSVKPKTTIYLSDRFTISKMNESDILSCLKNNVFRYRKNRSKNHDIELVASALASALTSFSEEAESILELQESFLLSPDDFEVQVRNLSINRFRLLKTCLNEFACETNSFEESMEATYLYARLGKMRE